MTLGPPIAVGVLSGDASNLGAPFSHSVGFTPQVAIGPPIAVGIINFSTGALGVPFSHTVSLIGASLGAPIAVAISSLNTGNLGTPFSHEISITEVTNLRPLRSGWPENRGYFVECQDGDSAILAQITRNSSNFASLYGRFDSSTTTVELGTGSAVTEIEIGRTGDVTLAGNLEISGEFSIVSDILLINKFTDGLTHAGFAIERGSTGADSLLHWNENNDRFELGLFDTQGGTVAPTNTLSTFVDLKVNNLLLDSTAITADGALTITATGGTSDLTFAARNNSITLNEAGETSLDGSFSATSIFGAINELASGNINDDITNNINDYTNGSGSNLLLGQVLYISSSDTVSLANAASASSGNIADPSRFLGVVGDAIVSGTNTVNVISEGTASVRFEQSLVLSAGDEVFLSTSVSGSATNVQPDSSGSVVESIGFVKNASAYDGNTALNAIVHLSKGPRIVNA